MNGTWIGKSRQSGSTYIRKCMNDPRAANYGFVTGKNDESPLQAAVAPWQDTDCSACYFNWPHSTDYHSMEVERSRRRCKLAPKPLAEKGKENYHA